MFTEHLHISFGTIHKFQNQDPQNHKTKHYLNLRTYQNISIVVTTRESLIKFLDS